MNLCGTIRKETSQGFTCLSVQIKYKQFVKHFENTVTGSPPLTALRRQLQRSVKPMLNLGANFFKCLDCIEYSSFIASDIFLTLLRHNFQLPPNIVY